jgi:hypothetical protein
MVSGQRGCHLAIGKAWNVEQLSMHQVLFNPLAAGVLGCLLP